MQPFLDSTDIIDDASKLHDRVDKYGYLFIKGLLPAAELESLRLKCLQIAHDAGWIKNDEPLADAVAEDAGFCLEPEPNYMNVYFQMYRLEEFQKIQHHPNLVRLFEKMFNENVVPHPRLIGRTMFPQRNNFTTPPHQDFIPIQGTEETYTAWFPLSALTPQMGGLQVASCSHKSGVYDFEPALGAGATAVVEPLHGKWVGNTFDQGDVLIFHSLMVHKGVTNRSDQLRMSIDARYQKASDPIAPGSLEPHPKRTWEEVYEGWPIKNSLKYYWHQWDLEIKDYDNSYNEKRDAMALEMAAEGNKEAYSVLQRIVARETDSEKKKSAEELLAALGNL